MSEGCFVAAELSRVPAACSRQTHDTPEHTDSDTSRVPLTLWEYSRACVSWKSLTLKLGNELRIAWSRGYSPKANYIVAPVMGLKPLHAEPKMCACSRRSTYDVVVCSICLFAIAG